VSILGQPSFTSAIASNPPTSRSLFGANGLAIDPTTGKLFISDEGNHRILRFSSTAAYQTHAEAEAVFGQPDFESKLANRGGAPSSLTLSAPANLCFDAEGNLWVADSGNARVLRYTAASSKPQFGGAADGVIGQPGFTTNTPATNSTADSGFIEPVGVAVDSDDNLYVLENGNAPRILRFANAKTAFGDVAASSYLGTINGSNQFIPGVTATSFSTTPYGICVDAQDRLWVADASKTGCSALIRPPSPEMPPTAFSGRR
jgi:sugar lactone lactonase YvrE